jgi:PKD repeat protein
MKRLLFFIIIFQLSAISLIFGQQDRNFWFAAPAVTKNHCNGAPNCNTGDAPVKLIITTFDLPSTVTISQPANDISIYPLTGFTPIVLNIAANSTQQIVLWTDNFNVVPAENQMRKNVECRPAYGSETTPLNSGLNITATADIAVYYIVDEPYNSEIFALKGKNALGTDFYASFQTNQSNHYFNPTMSIPPPASPFRPYEPFISSIDIVAVDPGITRVWVYPTRPIEGWGTILPPDSFFVDLQYGQTISLMPKDYYKAPALSQFSVLPANHLTGTRIRTKDGKRIAVTLKDDSVDGDTGCWDLLGDQTIPVESVRDDGTRKPVIGADYVVMRGNLGAGNRDRAYILATKNGTNVAVTDITLGGPPTNFVLNAGQQATYALAPTTKVVYIKSNDINKPVYVFHVTGAGGGCELGSAILPTISSCTGSFEVGFFRNNEPAPPPATRKQFLVNILARDGALDSFLLNGDVSIRAVINSTGFTKIPGTPWWAGQFNLSSIIPINSPYLLKNTMDIFHLGIMHGGNADGGNYGYFSNYAEVEAVSYVAETGDPGAKICYGETIQLVATGGLSYEWIPSTYLSDPFTDKPFCTAFSSIKYDVIVKGASCAVPDTSIVPVNVADSLAAKFDVDITQGCAPLTVRCTDLSYGGTKYYWYIDGVLFSSVKNPPPYTFYNNTNAAIDYEIEEEVDNPYCLKVYTRTIRVYPEINAGFEQDTVIGCQPLFIQFTDTSTGNIDTTQYLWDFGDLGQSFNRNPSHIYTNTGNSDSVFTVRLITTSPYFCRDTAQSFVTAHPRIAAALAIDKSSGCSPLIVNMNPGNSVGVDTFKWDINYWYSDSTYITRSNSPIQLIHQDTSTVTGPDTLYVNLTTINRMGCTDTFPQKMLVVYPEVSPHFDISTDEICDSMPILFTNNSVGYELFYEWDFDDGTIFDDTTGTDYTNIFFNRSNQDTTYTVTLKATSDFFCENEFDTIITVHPFIKSNFGIDYLTNCAPIDAQLTDQSIRAHQYDWDFGDGSDTTYTVPAPIIYHTFWNNSFLNDTTYTIQLITRNNEGCTDTISRSILLFPKVVAAFDLTDAVGCSPRSVLFENNSTGGLLSYLWQFGNSSSGTSSAPAFVKNYTNLGQDDTTYYVSLTATNPYGCDSTDYDSVKVYASISADFNMPVSDSCSPFTIRLDNLSSAGAKVYDWTFQGTALPINHNFEPVLAPFSNTSLVEDTIIVSLVAYGINDPPHRACADTQMKQVVVFPELSADFNLDLPASCQPYISNITNNTNIKNGTVFQWLLDNSFYSSSVNPAKLNIPNLTNNSVLHTLKLNGSSKHGCTDSLSRNFTVYSLVDAKFTVDKPAFCSGDSIYIDRSTSRGGITNYAWNFNNEMTSNRSDATFYHPFTNTILSNPVSKFVELTVTNGLCDSAWIQYVSVYPKVTAAFTPDNTAICYPHNTLLTNGSTNALSYFWNFGDGSGSTDQNPSHIFENFDQVNDETFTINLISRSLYNCYDSIEHDITIYAKPDAGFYFPVTVSCPPFNAQMINTSIPNNGLTYLWTFPDHSTSTQKDAQHLFDNSSSSIIEYPVELIVTSLRSCKDTATHILNVYPNVNVNFAMSDSLGCSPLIVNFTGDTTHVSKLYWYLNGIAFSTLKDPTYRFTNETAANKLYNIKFEAYSVYNCMASRTRPITVFPSPGAEFIPDPILQDYNTQEDQTTVIFYNETMLQNIWSYKWDYGDGSIDNQSEGTFEHTYRNLFWGDEANNFKIPIILIAWNITNTECRDSVVHEIIINPPLPQIDLAEDIAACVPFTVDFSATTKYIYSGQFEWDFGVEGATSTAEEPTYTYNIPGVYSAKLVVRGAGGTNWDYKIITVYPKPEVEFTFNDSIVFDSSQTKGYDYINFYNQTRFGNTWEWYFDSEEFFSGGAPDSYEKDPVWHYDDIGTYHVVLVASSDEACKDTLIHSTPILVLGEGYLEFPTGFFVNPSGPEDENATQHETGNKYLFYPANSGIAEYRLEVYNRWGVLIFKSIDVNKGWNGYIKGDPADQDVYIWRAKGRYTNGQPFDKSGDVTLLRGKAE